MIILDLIRQLVPHVPCNTDNVAFYMHYRLTVLLFAIFTAIYASGWFGEPITCQANSEFDHIVTTWCLNHGIYFLPSEVFLSIVITRARPKRNVPHLGRENFFQRWK